MPNILLLYGTREGQTAKIARHIETTLEAGGANVHTVEARRVSEDLRIEAFDGVIIGSSVHLGKHDAHVVRFVQRHRADLEQLPTAFFSVSLSAAGDTPESKRDVDHLLEAFTRETGWHPVTVNAIAGALLYTQYNPLLRFIMRRKAAHYSDDVDTSRDYEYTDWDGVTAFGSAMLEQIEERA
ncbi:MAG: flavodoxin domain-containing protein [Pseudomonadota bacterium]